ncbi:MAG: hypothetical protein PVG51_00515, partial [Desulfosarcina sp.]
MTITAGTQRTLVSLVAACLLFVATGSAAAAPKSAIMPADVSPVLKYLLDLVNNQDGHGFDAHRVHPLISFMQAHKAHDTVFRADGTFDAPSAYHEFRVNSDLKRLLGYIYNTNIPSFFLWPSSLRLAQWTRVDGGEEQLDQLRSAADELKGPIVIKGTERATITPDQHTGAYYSYDVDKMVILTPLEQGMALISVYIQREPSAVGRKGWVLGDDDDWSYLYTQETGLNVGGLGWVSTYMYDSFGMTVYYQPDPDTPVLDCAVVSWVKAGWAGINMVQPKHIHRGLVRVSTAFKAILENPRLPDPNVLAETFSDSKNLPTATLKAYGKDYFQRLEKRLTAAETLRKKLGQALDVETALAQMTREELYAALALDYF